MPIEIKADVKYRIKNVDLGTYLELRNYEQDFVLRPKKESIFQHFIFKLKESLGPNDHKIYNIKPVKLQEDPEAFLQAELSNGSVQLDELSNNSLSDWVVSGSRSDPGQVYLYLNTGVGPQILQVNDNQNLIVTQHSAIPNRRSFSNVPLADKYQWEITEVNASDLPEGDNQNYRIRTLLGTTLKADTNGAVELEVNNSGANRHWTIKPNPGNGFVTIHNVGTNKYLATHDAGELTWEVVTSDQKATWQIQPTSSFTYSVYIALPAHIRGEFAMQEFALAIGRNKAILKPKKSVHNQTWLIENASLGEETEVQIARQSTEGQDGRQEIGGQNTRGQSLAENEVAPGLVKGTYQIRSAHLSRFYLASYDQAGSPSIGFRVLGNPSNYNKDYNTHFKVEQYKTGATIFIISLRSGRTFVVNNNSGTPSLNTQNTFYMLKLVPAEEAKHFFIMMDNPAASGLVLTSPVQDRNSPILAAKEQNNNLQVWEFIPV